MTPEERAFCEEVRRAALDIVGYIGLIAQDAEPGSKQHSRARKASAALMALASMAVKRVHDADMADDATALQATGYDLAALATAAPSPVKE